MDQKRFSVIILIIIFSILVVLSLGYYLWAQNSGPQPTADNDTTVRDQTDFDNKSIPDATDAQLDETTEGEVEDAATEWTNTTNDQLGIQFDHPVDTKISSLEQRQTEDGITIRELIVTPAGPYPTMVHFFSTDTSLEQAKNIRIYSPENIERSEFTAGSIDDHTGISRIDYYLYNECTNQLTVADKGGTVYGFHIIQCPSHPEDYDQLRRNIANSLDLI